MLRAETKHAAGRVLCGSLCAALVLLSLSVAQAGPAFFAGSLEDDKFVPAEKAADFSYSIQFSTLTARAEDGTARVTIRETIKGTEASWNTICLIPLPAAVDPKSVSVSAGTDGAFAELKSVAFLNADEAQELYETVARGSGSVKILALSGRPALLIRQYELSGSAEFQIQFDQPVRTRQGVQWIECPMPKVEMTGSPIERIALTAAVHSDKPLRAVFSPTHDVRVERDGLQTAEARMKAEAWAASEDFRLCWVADEDDLGLRVLTYREEGDKEGYFMVVGNPTGGDKPLDKDVIFVLDTSGSMRGEKMEQARAAIEYCLTQLNPGDRFNIVTFGTEVASFRESPVAREDATLAEAQIFVEDIIAQGRTNISGALEKALAGQPQPGRPRIAIFLTDGTPTAGELVSEKIIENVEQANSSGTKIFVMGVGHDVNAHLLDKLATTTDGSSEYVAPHEEIDAKVATLYDRLSYPVLSTVAADFGELETSSVFPQKLGALFKGSEIMIFGRYRGGGRQTIKLAGTLDGQPKEYLCVAHFPEQHGDKTNEFVAPLWATRNIGFLLQEIRLHGHNEELMQEIVRLSKKFGIVTEYTQFLSAGQFGGAGFGGGLGDEDRPALTAALDQVRRNIEVANQIQTGRWAVQQALNEKDLQMRKCVNNAVNFYRDRRGQVVAEQNVYQIGARTFYLANGQWVDSTDKGERKERKIELFSDEYFTLLRKHPEFAKAQQLGWAMTLNVGEERIVVEKEGKAIDEELQKRSQPQQIENEAPLNRDQNQQFRNQLNNRNFDNFQQLPQIEPQIRRQLQDLNNNENPNGDGRKR